MVSLGQGLHEMERHKEAEALLREALHASSGLYGDANAITLLCAHYLGVVLRQLKQLEEAERLLRKALAGRRLLSPKSNDTIATIRALADVLHDRSVAAEQESVLLRKEAVASQPPDTEGQPPDAPTYGGQ